MQVCLMKVQGSYIQPDFYKPHRSEKSSQTSSAMKPKTKTESLT